MLISKGSCTKEFESYFVKSSIILGISIIYSVEEKISNKNTANFLTLSLHALLAFWAILE